jgi:type I restriction enzyme S subunit
MTETNTPETDLLFQHFATLATGPGGIARLRALILQLAVQGKLGTQDESDEPANVLVAKIRKERGKIEKKWKTFDPILDSELPFNLPKGWVWNRLGDIVILKSGSSFDRTNEKFDLGVPYVKVGDMNFPGNEKTITTSSRFVKKNEENIKDLIPKNSIIFPKRGGAIATNKKRIVQKEIFADSNTMAMICPDSVNLDYLYYWFSQIDLWTLNSGTSVPQINNKDIDPLFFPLPPLAEQHRIVEKVDRLMALCNDFEKQQQRERSTCLQLGTASFAGLQGAESPEEFERQWAHICDTFDLMLDCPENVAVLRQTILQLAVQGKLGTQDEGDEPASVLLERIRGEKERLVKEGLIKKEKPLKIPGDTPFTIPKTWIWEVLGNLTPKITDGEHFRPNTVQNGVLFLSAKDIRDDYIDFSAPLFIDEETAERCWKRCNPDLNDILVVSRGAGVGRCCIVNTNKLFCLLGSVILIKNSPLINSKYLLYSLKSVIINNQISSLSSNTAQQALYIRDIKNTQIPLPPLAEQHRIVEKVDRFMALCDQLETQLKERAGVQERFAKAVVGGVAT